MKFKVTMEQVCKQVVEIEGAHIKNPNDAIKQVMMGRGAVVYSNFQPSLQPDSWKVDQLD